eukprot:gnl/TRDRNA2_/TRDRNA2_195172_c0_seq1.p3 gnl/TRDRNA2_/TRDRNA2_195172_c0~~gnl/TRDRNA2_/TRDRNA2_195172_c0_seq1.p3  ORF type:complete len:137 (-),score=23.42 gnl/TRDRNA2_/TRDRNA2_195172_c0_seq1:91-501(-)
MAARKKVTAEVDMATAPGPLLLGERLDDALSPEKDNESHRSCGPQPALLQQQLADAVSLLRANHRQMQMLADQLPRGQAALHQGRTEALGRADRSLRLLGDTLRELRAPCAELREASLAHAKESSSSGTAAVDDAV